MLSRLNSNCKNMLDALCNSREFEVIKVVRDPTTFSFLSYSLICYRCKWEKYVRAVLGALFQKSLTPTSRACARKDMREYLWRSNKEGSSSDKIVTYELVTYASITKISRGDLCFNFWPKDEFWQNVTSSRRRVQRREKQKQCSNARKALRKIKEIGRLVIGSRMLLRFFISFSLLYRLSSWARKRHGRILPYRPAFVLNKEAPR